MTWECAGRPFASSLKAMLERAVLWIASTGALLSVACAGTPKQPPGEPPAPETVTKEEPGGNAYDPHAAALARQLDSSWGWRNDKDDQLHAPLADWENWKRVRYRLIDHFTGFRYGDDHHMLTVAFVLDPPRTRGMASRGSTESPVLSSEACMEAFEDQARARVADYGVDYADVHEVETQWRNQPLMVHMTDGEVDVLLRHYDFSAAWAAYPAYEDACLVYAVIVPWDGHEQLAKQVRDKWVAEAFGQMNTKTPGRPTRK